MTIGEALKKLRQSLELTQAQMIQGSKISITHYSKMEKGQNRIFVDDLMIILQLHGVSPADFFKEYFPTKEDTISSKISQELNRSFYKNDIKKAKELQKLILNTKHVSTELKDRAGLIIAVLTARDNKTDTTAITQAMHDFFKYKEWMNDYNAITLLSNSIRKDNLKDLTPLIMMLIRKYKKLNEQNLTKQRRLATVGINYLYVLRKYFSNSDKIAFKILSWLESLTADPELCLYKELILYFHSVYTDKRQAILIKKLLKLSDYPKIADNLPE